MKKRVGGFAVLGLIVVLIISLVIAQESAGLIADETQFANSDVCFDSDGGVFTKNVGGVASGRFFVRNYFDTCIGGEGRLGRMQIREYYCDANGRSQSQDMGQEQLGEGYCTNEAVVIEGRNRRVRIGKWVSLAPSCEVRPFGAVNQRGDVFRTGCYNGEIGPHRRGGGAVSEQAPFAHRRYSCNENVTEVIVEEVNCLGIGARMCNNQLGCSGVCQDTDPGNANEIAGRVTSDGSVFDDVCVGNGVRQYQCSTAGRAVPSEVVRCEVNKRCQDGRCVNVFVEAENQNQVNERTTTTLEELVGRINELLERISALEGRIAELEAESAEASLSPRFF